jgi:hypothetical protein
MVWQAALAIGGAELLGGFLGSRSADKAAKAQERGSQAAIAEQRAGREAFEARMQPFTNIGLSAADPLMNLLGIQGYQPDFTPQALPPTDEMIAIQGQLADLDKQESSSEALRALHPLARYTQGDDLTSQRQGLQAKLDELTAANMTQAPPQQLFTPSSSGMTTGQNELLNEINPLVSFLRQEGFEDIQESAAAGGKLRSGGTREDLTRFNTQLTSTIAPQLQEQKFNQLFNVLGLGQSSAAGQGQAALQTAGNISNLQQSIGNAQAQGAAAKGQAIQNTIGGLAGTFGAYQGGAFGSPPPPTQPIAQSGMGFNSRGFV